ncbi:protein RALF-like 19 [Ananas comosus]|uniref:Protein RALF-like 19 n=2 Tax=Ananas comosus TaxID=4615 RepID=A0A6P5EXU5_ANACO|nr:protein RALF-like 19 [Ananas comosus]CAD1842216.1 unnamed protein product [Ananas comosus var. bracteatus]
MALPRPALLLAVLLLLLLSVACAAHSAPLDADWGLARLDFEDDELTQACDGTVGECADKDDEDGSAEAEYVDTRRGLAAAYPGRTRFISYGALMKNRVPCSRRGQSYYNCRRRRRANPYHRGCSIITRCARILR